MFIKGKELDKGHLANILLIQLGDIGDVVYSLPCARALKENFPQARVVIAVLAKARGLARCCPWIDEVIAIDKAERSLLESWQQQTQFWRRVRGFRFDLAIDLRTGSRGAILAFLSGAPQRVGRYNPVGHWWRARLFSHVVWPAGGLNQYIAEYYQDTISYYGIKTEHLNPVICPQPGQVAESLSLLRQEAVPEQRPILAIQPFSRWQYKEWAPEKYVELIGRLQAEFDIAVVLTGSPEERPRVQMIADGCGGQVFNLAGRTALDLLPALVQQAALFFGVDSAGVHIAAAVGTPTVSLYGPSAADTWAPRGEGHLVISKKWPCLPCKATGCQGSMRSRCLDELTVDEVLPAIQQRLQSICR